MPTEDRASPRHSRKCPFRATPPRAARYATVPAGVAEPLSMAADYFGSATEKRSMPSVMWPSTASTL
jgi:hypothetical protein